MGVYSFQPYHRSDSNRTMGGKLKPVTFQPYHSTRFKLWRRLTTVASIQLPFMIVFLLFAPYSGIIISKLGNAKPTILGSIITVIGFFSLFLFHSSELMVSINLAILASGLSLMRVGGLNIVLESTPRQFSRMCVFSGNDYPF